MNFSSLLLFFPATQLQTLYFTFIWEIYILIHKGVQTCYDWILDTSIGLEGTG